MTLPITTLLTSALAIWLLVLSVQVIRQRGTAKVSLSDGGDETLLRRIRAQGNLTEYAPIMVLLVALAEIQNANATFLWLVAAAFFLARLAHGYALAFSQHSPALRTGGATVTFVSLAIMALYNLTLPAG